MKISDEQLRHLEGLARIELEPAERERIRGDLEELLGYFEEIAKLDTEGVEEMVRPVATNNVLRDDEVRDSLPRDRALELAVEEQDGFFRVPRMIDVDGN